MTATSIPRPVEAAFTAPADYGQLVEQYGDYMRRVVRRMLGPHAPPQDVEDTLQYCHQQLQPGGNRSGRGVIEQYDSSIVSQYTGRPLSFRAFLANKINLYCRGRRQALATHYGREQAIADVPVSDGSATWIELFGPAEWDDYHALDDGEFLGRMREAVAAWPDREAGLPPLRSLLDLMAAEVEAGRNPTPAVVARKLRITPGQAGDYLGRLQGALSALPSGVRYEAGGLQLTAAEMRTAADALRATPGHHVMPAFEACQSRLAACGKQWYVKVAKAEMRRFPSARLPGGTNVRGGRTSPVKFALQHWFDRLCPPLPEPAPAPPEPAEEPESALDLLEAALWRMPGADAARVDLVLAAAGPAVAEAVRAAFGDGP